MHTTTARPASTHAALLAHLREILGEEAACSVLEERPLSRGRAGDGEIHVPTCPGAGGLWEASDLIGAHWLAASETGNVWRPISHSCVGAGAALSEVWFEERDTISRATRCAPALSALTEALEHGGELFADNLLHALEDAERIGVLAEAFERCAAAARAVMRPMSAETAARMVTFDRKRRDETWLHRAQEKPWREARTGEVAVVAVDQSVYPRLLAHWEPHHALGPTHLLLALPRREARALTQALGRSFVRAFHVETGGTFEEATWLREAGALEVVSRIFEDLDDVLTPAHLSAAIEAARGALTLV